MSGERHERITRLFARACELPAEERDAFLRRACAGDDALRAEVESLLAAERRGKAELPTAGLKDVVGQPAAPEAPSPTIPVGGSPGGRGAESRRRLGDFEILGELGRGGMGVVYDARQLSLKRRVALKVLPPALGLSPQTARRFEREAQAAARLHHTNIVPVHAIGEHDGHHFYAMERIDGQSLDRILRDLAGGKGNSLMEQTVAHTTVAESRPTTGKRPATEQSVSLSDGSTSGREWFDTVARLVAEVADALEYAHGRGVVHRDIKPGNLILSEEGRLCVTDFGLARLQDEPGLTVSGSFLGTPAYMSPEQVAAGRVGIDHRTDIYSLGAVLYEMLTLQRPFRGESREELLSAVLTGEPRRPRRVNGRIPLDLETICLKAMEKDPSRRYASANELADDLRRYLGHGLIRARRAGPGRRAVKWVHRHPTLSLLATATVIVLLLAGFLIRLSAARSTERALRAIADARLSLAQGDYRKGLVSTDRALSLKPTLPEARLLRARLLLGLQKVDEAVDEGRGMLARDPNDWTGHLILAQAALEHDVADLSAEQHLAAVRRFAPQNAENYYLQGLFAERAERAVELLDKALESDPTYAEALHERCLRKLDLKDFPAARLDAERLIALRPRSALGRRAMARVFKEEYEPKRALEQYEIAIALDPEDPWSYAERARVLDEMDRDEEALGDLDRAIELDPGSAAHRVARGGLRVDLGKYEAAVADYERALELSPEFLSAYTGLLRTYDSWGRPDDALATIDRLRTVSADWKNSKALREALAWISAQQNSSGDTEGVLATLQEIVDLDPDNPYGYSLRAGYHALWGDQEAKRQDCDRAAELEIHDLDDLVDNALNWASVCHHRLGETVEALSRVVASRPNWAKAYWVRAWTLLWDRRFDESLANYDRAIELAPASDFYAHRAGLLEQLGRSEDALRDYDRQIELGYDNENLRIARSFQRIRAGLVDEAFADVDHVIALKPDKGRGYRARSQLYYKLGDPAAAIEEIDKAIEIEPGNPWGYLYRAELVMLAGRPCEQAMADLEAFRRTQLQPELWVNEIWVHAAFVGRFCPDHLEVEEMLEAARQQTAFVPGNGLQWKNLGFAAYRAGLYEESCDAFLRANELRLWGNDGVAALFGLAMCHGQLGEMDRARAYYEQALERKSVRDPHWTRYEAYRDEAAEVLGRVKVPTDARRRDGE